jgi:hypothetical protein
MGLLVAGAAFRSYGQIRVYGRTPRYIGIRRYLDRHLRPGLKGQILFHLKRCEEAIPCFQGGLTNEAETPMLAEALRHTARYRESIEELKTPPLDETLALQALVIRAANHVELDEAETAIDFLQTAPLKKRNLDDTLKQVHFVLAKAYEKAGNTAVTSGYHGHVK